MTVVSLSHSVTSCHLVVPSVVDWALIANYLSLSYVTLYDVTETSCGRSRQRAFFQEELRRLQENLKRESSKIVQPNRRKYTPFVFNTLEPYYNTHTTRYLIEQVSQQAPETNDVTSSTAVQYIGYQQWVTHSVPRYVYVYVDR